MELEFYRSPLIMPALAACIAATIYLLKEQKGLGALLMLLGFSIVTITMFATNHCIGLVSLGLNTETIMCSNFIPHINGAGYILIGLGIMQLVKALKQNA